MGQGFDRVESCVGDIVFEHGLSQGDLLDTWLFAGPEYIYMGEELTERTFFENPEELYGFSVARKLRARLEEEMCLQESCEGKEFAFLGHKGKWRYERSGGKYFGFGEYFTENHLNYIIASTWLRSVRRQKVIIQFGIRVPNVITILLNHRKIFDNMDLLQADRRAVYAEPVFYEVELPLEEGENSLMICSMRIARNAEAGIYGKILSAGTGEATEIDACDDGGLEVFLRSTVPADIRCMLEKSIRSAHLYRECFERGQKIEGQIWVPEQEEFAIMAQLYNDDNQVIISQEIDRQGRLALDQSCECGGYRVLVFWKRENVILEQLYIPVHIVEIVPELEGYDKIGERKQAYLSFCAGQEDSPARDLIYVLSANYKLGRYDKITDAVVEKICELIEKKIDCADFIMLPMLDILFEDQKKRKLKESQRERMKKAVLSFKFWIDEARDCMMWFDSENHRMCFHVVEYLAGLLYPNDIFANSGQNGLFHSFKGRTLAGEWLTQRLRYGFNEFHSDTYLPVTLTALLCLWEHIPYEEFSLKNKTTCTINFISFLMAANTFHGISGAPRGRSYSRPMKNPLLQGSSTLIYLLYGESRTCFILQHGSLMLAGSSYVPPRYLYDMAYDYTLKHFAFRQGVFPVNKQYADILLRRTPSYLMASVQDHNVGMVDAHMHTAQITMGNDIVVFWSAPLSTGEGSGIRPDYWAGQAAIPRTLQYQNLLFVIWENVKNPFIWMTHCFFEKDRFDRVICVDGWTFAQKGTGYLAITSRYPHHETEEGIYAGRELISEGSENVWIAYVAEEEEYGNMESFMEYLLKSRISYTDQEIKVEGILQENIEAGYRNGFKADGRDLEMAGRKVDCDWLVSHYGSNEYLYQYGQTEERIQAI